MKLVGLNKDGNHMSGHGVGNSEKCSLEIAMGYALIRNLGTSRLSILSFSLAKRWTWKAVIYEKLIIARSSWVVFAQFYKEGKRCGMTGPSGFPMYRIPPWDLWNRRLSKFLILIEKDLELKLLCTVFLSACNHQACCTLFFFGKNQCLYWWGEKIS